MSEEHLAKAQRAASGVPRLDEVLHGGFLVGRSYLVTGGPGMGKTTLGLQFLTAGPSSESALLVSFGEAGRHIVQDAASMGIDMGRVAIIDLSPSPDDGDTAGSSSGYEGATGVYARIIEKFPVRPPQRVFVDAFSQLCALVADGLQFRQEAMSLLEHLTRAGSTVLVSAERDSVAETDLRYLTDGILELEARPAGRTLTAVKFRGSGFAAGVHSVVLDECGMSVYPRLVPTEHRQPFVSEQIPSGIAEIDTLIGGGLDRGTVTFFSGPTGVGKTSLGVQFMNEAAKRHERSVIFSFDERVETLRQRCRAIGVPIDDMIQEGHLAIREIEALHYGANEFAWQVRHEVETLGAQVVMLDSLSGYEQSLRGDDLKAHLHALCRYLANMGVTVLLVNEVSLISGASVRVSEYGVSYLADAIMLLRYVEIDGEMRKVIGMLKKRTGDFERTLREFTITSDGVGAGQPLSGLHGVLTGTPW